MFIAVLCVLLAMLQPFVLSVLARSSTRKSDYLPSPREYNESLTGWHRRAHFAQLNSFEAFPPFAAAVLVAWLAGVPPVRTNLLAVLFVVLRVSHAAFYLSDKSWLRSLVWKLAMMAVVALFVLALVRLA
jgi:uncharacterized MAPEG superfamily protein